jgi:ferredoxin
MRIEVDWDLCESNAVCMGILPDVFQVGDDDMLTVLKPEVTPENEAQVREVPPAGHLDRGLAITRLPRAFRSRR